MTKAKGTFTRETSINAVTTTDNGVVSFPGLKLGDGASRVSANIGYAYEFGAGKCSVTVSVQCDQTNDMIDLAGDMALQKAQELTEEGMKMVTAHLKEQA